LEGAPIRRALAPEAPPIGMDEAYYFSEGAILCPDELAVASIRMAAAAARGGSVGGVIFHTDQGSEYTSGPFAGARRSLGVLQSMGRVGSALDNAAAESFFSTLEHELLSRRQFATRDEARRVVAGWIDRFYNRIRRHSTTGMRSPIDYELAATTAAAAA
jgi:transposase InsO family protein